MQPLNRSVSVVGRYFWNILIAIDQLFNAFLAGDPDETMSSRLGKWRRKYPKGTWRWNVAYTICMALHFLDPHHCRESIEEDEGKDAVDRIVSDK